MRTGGVMLAIIAGADRVRDRRGLLRRPDRDGARPRLPAGIFNRVQAFSAREVGRFGTPSLITRTTNDVQQVQMLALMTFTLMVSAPIMCVGGIILALNQDVPLSSLLLVAVPVLGVVISLIIRRMRPLFRLMQDRIDTINRVLREQITGVRVIRAFVRDRHERERFATANTELFDVSLGAGRLMALMFPSVMLVLNLSSVAVLWFGGHLVASGAMQIGALTAFLSYLMQILMSVMMATFMFMMVPRAEVSAERIMEVLDTESSVRPAGRAGADPRRPRPSGAAGRRVPLPGRRAAGAARHQPDRPAGRDHRDHRRHRQRQDHAAQPDPAADRRHRRRGAGRRRRRPRARPGVLSAAVGLVPQKPYLFSGTVATNLRYGNPRPPTRSCGTRWRSPRPATSSSGCPAAWTPRSPRAARTCPAASGSAWPSPGRWCTSRRSTCSTTRSPRSTTPPTRPCARPWPPRRADATVVIVAQRVATIRHADRIVVLDAGRVVGTGTHDELMDTNETYREIVLSQLTEQEAA